MKFFILVSVLVLCQGSSIPDIISDWFSFKAAYGRTYKSPSEEQHRMKVFQQNKELIELHNGKFAEGLVTFYLAVNHYADLTGNEFKGFMNKYKNSSRRSFGSVFQPAAHLDVPDSIDWRQKGAVTPVKDQGQCGSCWAFSATGGLEGQSFRKTGQLVSLSEQQLVDCGSVTGNDGCDGGLMDEAFRYIQEYGGIYSEEAYPYEGVDGECRYMKAEVAATDSGFVDLPEEDEEALKKAVGSIGPISVAIDASQPTFQFYSGGVYYDRSCSSVTVDHGVLVVGYGSDGGQDYWLVKNSWTKFWGERGYVKMARNKKNHCGIASSASYPIV